MHPPSGREGAIAALAARQGGVVGRNQLLALGLLPGTIDNRVRAGRLIALRRGVYALGHRGLGVDGPLHAALLASGPGAALSHQTAAARWGIRPTEGATIHTSVVRGGRRGDRTLRIHRPRSLPEDEVTRDRGLRITTPARTLVDLADVLGRPALDRALEQTLILRLYDHRQVVAVLDRARGRGGAGVLRAAVADLGDTPAELRSELEREFVRFCADHGLPRPAPNVDVLGKMVDAFWAHAGVVVELDGRDVHGTPQAFERDRRRDRELTAAGLRVVRVTTRQLRGEPAAVAADLHRLV